MYKGSIGDLLGSRSETEQGGGAGTEGGTALGDSSTPPPGHTRPVSGAIDPLAGRVLSHYRLEERLGAGGMGVLYRATDLKLGRAVAIKLLARHLVSDETAKARFVREARAASALDHPNIANIYEIGEADGELFIAMALYEGETLKQRLQKGRLAVDEALSILRQVLLGLEAAHRAAIVHRDIKPANILVTSHGIVKILDFGLAKLISDAQAETMTQAGQTMGTTLYMSPEQLRGDAVDARSDLWSVGVLAYELLAKTSPFQTDSSAATVARILHDEPPSLTAVPGIPVWLADLIAQLLRKNPSERPQSATEVIRSLDGPATVPTRRWSLHEWFSELKRRRVFRVAVAYAVGAFGLLQGADVVVKALHLSEWMLTVLVVLTACGLPLSLVLAWVFDLTPRGIERTAPGLKAVAQREAAPVFSSRALGRLILAALIGAVGVVGALAYWRYTRVRWAHEEALPEIATLVDKNRWSEAFSLAERVEKILPDDPTLRKVFKDISRTLSIKTAPEGADVSIAEYASGEFRHLGRSPLTVRVPWETFRWRVVKEGFVPVDALTSNGRTTNVPLTPTDMQFVLDKEHDLPQGMVRVRGGPVGLGFGFGHLPQVELGDYFIDRFEVTNRQFKQFVEQGGYRRRELWKEPFVDGARTLPWEEGIGRFRDRTGRPGPATWLSGDYPEGQEDFPVTGVSWYEAAAYAAFVGKSLPTVYHWSRAAGTWASGDIIPASNFGGKALAAVGTQREIGPYGTHDMAGNAKEWCWNANGVKRFILGGAWNEPSYMFASFDAKDPFDRAPTHGFRLVKNRDEEKVLPRASAPIDVPQDRDLAKEKPVADAIFEVYRSLYGYDRVDLKASVDAVDDSSPRFRKEKVGFTAAYGNERVIAYVYTPKTVPPPWQPIVIFPGADAMLQRSIDDPPTQALVFSFVLNSGRAVVVPVYKSTYERGDTLKPPGRPEPTRFYRDHVIDWSKDLGRTLDYLESRTDLDRRAIGYLGFSWGAAMAPIMLAAEPRIRVAALIAGGLYSERTLPEVDQLNFAPRARQPVLLVGGRFDSIFPLHSSQAPFFALLGAAPEHKRHLLVEIGHSYPNDVAIKEVLDWFDHYLGPVH